MLLLIHTNHLCRCMEVAFNDVQLKVLKPFIQDVRSMSGTLALAGKVNGT